MTEREICAQCGGPVRVEEKIQRFKYGQGEDAVELSARVPVLICDACEERYTDGRAEDARHEAVCAYLGRLTPSQIKTHRARLHLTQERLAEISGHGIASIKRWELGTQIQNASADRLLRLLFTDAKALAAACALAGLSNDPPKFRTNFSPVVRRAASNFKLREAA
jgi:putative zinc finger/helix-turn-helix YgiT family protein